MFCEKHCCAVLLVVHTPCTIALAVTSPWRRGCRGCPGVADAVRSGLISPAAAARVSTAPADLPAALAELVDALLPVQLEQRAARAAEQAQLT